MAAVVATSLTHRPTGRNMRHSSRPDLGNLGSAAPAAEASRTASEGEGPLIEASSP
jgi:hypothetical protein